jgi:inorganic pyrophosphatase
MITDLQELLDELRTRRSLRARIEVPRWGFIKPRASGGIDFVSPFPSPYNYGCAPELRSTDGDPLDVVVLGRRLERGTVVTLPIRGVIRFIDEGVEDPKVVCSAVPLTALEREGLLLFFRWYSLCKRLLNVARFRTGTTRCAGWIENIP